MSSKEEELYFAVHEQDLRAAHRAKITKAAEELEEKRKIARSAGTKDIEVATHINALGFDGDSARVFDLLPLVHVAWADGKLQRGERATILEVLRHRGIKPGSEAFRTMESLLEEEPSDAFMRESLAVLREVTEGLTDRASTIVDLCIQVAASSGGFLGLKLGATIGDDEKKQIEEVLAALGPAASKSFQDGLG